MAYLYTSATAIFDFDDVMLVPQECVIASRSHADVAVELHNQKFKLPVIPANMSTIIDKSAAEYLASNGYFYVMHRFDVDAVEFTKHMQSKGLIASVSLGIKGEDYETIERFVREGVTPEFITVDVAHGDSAAVFAILEELNKKIPESFVIAGNVATGEAALRLARAGANAVKVGVAPGSVCLTGPNTGFGSRGWQLSAVKHVSEALDARYPEVKVIADGGIRHYGDIAKAIAFGADLVMVGSMFAGHDENPGDLIEIDGAKFKEFFGSASEFQKGESKHVEGKRELMPYKGAMKDTLRAFAEHLQSSVSYAGGRELYDLRNVPYVILR